MLQRMNTIVPGPFGVGGRRNGESETRSSSAGRGHQRTLTLNGPKDYTNPPSATASHFEHFRRPSTAGSEYSQTSVDSRDAGRKSLRRAPTLASGTMASRPGTPKTSTVTPSPMMAEPNEASFETFRKGSLSQAFPLRSMSRDPGEAPTIPLPRRPSEPSVQTPRRPSETPTPTRPLLPPMASSLPSDAAIDRRGLTPTKQRTFSEIKSGREKGSQRGRSGSRAGLEPERGTEHTPPIPNASQRSHDHHLHHTPTESQSSNGSGYGSEARTGSSRSTPPLPEPMEKSSRRRPASPPMAPSIKSAKDDRRDLQDLRPNKSRNVGAPPTPPKGLPNRPTPHARQLPPAPVIPEFEPEPPPSPGLHSRRDAERGEDRSSRRRPEIPTSGRRPTTAAKGNCRGCGELIRGKSVSSADGRLTGRYHKECK